MFKKKNIQYKKEKLGWGSPEMTTENVEMKNSQGNSLFEKTGDYFLMYR